MEITKFDAISNFFKGNPSDALLWYLDFDLKWIANCPAHIREWVDLAADLGCTWPIIWFGGYKEEFDSTANYREYRADDKLVKEWHTPVGSLHSRIKYNHPVEYTIKTIDDCRVLKYIYEHTLTYKNEQPHQPFHGVSLSTSPVQQLLQYEMGLETFYTLLMTDTHAVEQLMDTMQQKQMERTSLVCQFEIPMIYQGENTSSTMISPEYYKKYSLPQIKQQADFIHSKDKTIILHMCGLLHHLLPAIKQTGINGIHSVTPPPVGDTEFSEVYDTFGGCFPIQGRFGSTQWYNLDEKEIVKNLSYILPVGSWRQRPFVLLVTLDGVLAEYEQLKRLARIIREFGSK
ncbi:MAG: Uroporphyrinogen-III decarboxylase [Parcubacteria group bacterium GW2011_GWA2_43_17]|jgi:hypothetical protein|nr:MAG: Uroporphyrinogen-III decarboxylase [Parcubacteria group bacterium GW2011_GWA2_43_17]OHB42310.1 MAG: hypothetical protein A2Y13_05110 [Planctomycetes bacterium GWC2_45_44]